jgi:hypothetical protein
VSHEKLRVREPWKSKPIDQGEECQQERAERNRLWVGDFGQRVDTHGLYDLFQKAKENERNQIKDHALL